CGSASNRRYSSRSAHRASIMLDAWSAATTSCRSHSRTLAARRSRAEPTCSPPSKQPSEREHLKMMIKLTGGKVYDPANGVNGEVRDIYISDGRIVAPAPEARIDQEHNLRGKVVMAGGIDPHTHIGGGKVTIARTLMPEDHEQDEVAHTA